MNDTIPGVVAFHEAGHAVITIVAGWGDRISEVAITPDDPQQGGYTSYNVPSAITPRSERLREISKNLAGPVSQVLFANDTIDEPYKSWFETSILDHLKTVADLNRAKCSYWRSDLNRWLLCTVAEERQRVAQFSDSNMCQPFKLSESFLRIWLVRPTISKSISVIADELRSEGIYLELRQFTSFSRSSMIATL